MLELDGVLLEEGVEGGKAGGSEIEDEMLYGVLDGVLQFEPVAGGRLIL